MLAREYCDMAKIKFKPVILSHHMLMGLKEGKYVHTRASLFLD
jgi:tyrosyl-tRNA synthetase